VTRRFSQTPPQQKMFRRAAIRVLREVNHGSNALQARTFASKSSTASKKKPSSIALAMASVALAGSVAATSMVDAKEKKPDIDQIKKEIVEIFDENNYMGPTFVRLAWHSAGTFSKHDGSGGSTGGTIRFKPEIDHGGNAGLYKAVNALEKVKKNHPEITYADLYILAGVAMIEEMGGPSVGFRFGRPDAESGKECTPDDRLPGADKGSKPKTINHIRDVFYRMGFNDREIVALIGAHAIGRCYPDRSGYSGPWTNAEWTFSNEYFRQLIENKWTLKKWNGPEQYEDPTGKLMMLPADMAFIWDPEFKKYVEIYAKDENLFFKDFAAAFQKLTENGVKFPEKTGWRKYIFFGPRGD
jgi:cytochrome c peroxidase